MKNKKLLLIIWTTLLFSTFISCQAKNVNLKPLNKKPEGKSKLIYFLDHKSKPYTAEKTPRGEQRYIFIRLYDPNYSDPLYIANLLQGGIALTEVNPENVSHASIGFDLSDYFFGLTSGGRYNLKIERCTDVASNDYMSKCDPVKSIQSTYAIAVTQEEYEKAYNLILKNLNNKQLKYAAVQNVRIAGYSVRRKFFTEEEQQQLGSEQLEDKLYDAKKTFKEYVKSPLADKRFVCSSFVAWVLDNSVERVSNFFDAHKTNYKFITPSDLPHIDGVEFLFSSTWADFDNAAKEFAEKNPDFEAYLPLQD